MKKFFNRSDLKIIACLSMLIDHIGLYFLPDMVFLRIVGRIAFPVFAFFIAEGFFYTHSKYKYLFLLLIFACLSQIPYYFLNNAFKLNILFSFVFSIIIMLFIFNIINGNIIDKIYFGLLIIGLCLFVICLDILNYINYGILGVMIPIAIWLFRNNNFWKYFVLFILLVLLGFDSIIKTATINFHNIIQFFALLAIPLLLLYNGQKGNLKLKYIFYIFYPFHLTIIYFVLCLM